MKRIPAMLALIAVLSCAPCFAQAKVIPSTNPELREKIQELIGVLNLEASAAHQLDQLLTTFQKLRPQVPNEFWLKARSEVDMKEFKEIVTDVWAKYYTIDDINALLAFYRSPVGKKMIEVQPALQRDVAAAGSDWGKKWAQRVEAELSQKAADSTTTPKAK